MGSAVWCHMTQGKMALCINNSSAPCHTAKMSQSGPRQTLLVCLPQTLKKKSQKVKQSPNPRKVRKIGEREKKHRRNFIKKVVVWAFLQRYRRGKQIEEMEKKQFAKIERILWEKKAEERQCCLQHACVIPQHLCIFFSAEQEQLRGKNAWLFQLDKKRDT